MLNESDLFAQKMSGRRDAKVCGVLNEKSSILDYNI